MKDYKLLLLSNPASGREREFNHWYECHLPELLRSSHSLVGAQRFRRVDSMSPGALHQHLVVAEFLTEDFAEGWERHLRDFRTGVETGSLTPPPAGIFAPNSSVQWAFEPIGPHLGK